MSAEGVEKVFIRAHYWLRVLRWAVGFQIGLALLLGFSLASRGLSGGLTLSADDIYVLAVGSIGLTLLALLTARRRRDVGAADMTVAGIRPLNRASRWDRRYPWAMLETVRIRVGLIGNRWLEVCPTGEPKFVLTARPTDPVGVLDALERFAGPEHPLTRAYAQLLDRP